MICCFGIDVLPPKPQQQVVLVLIVSKELVLLQNRDADSFSVPLSLFDFASFHIIRSAPPPAFLVFTTPKPHLASL